MVKMFVRMKGEETHTRTRKSMTPFLLIRTVNSKKCMSWYRATQNISAVIMLSCPDLPHLHLSLGSLLHCQLSALETNLAAWLQVLQWPYHKEEEHDSEGRALQDNLLTILWTSSNVIPSKGDTCLSPICLEQVREEQTTRKWIRNRKSIFESRIEEM